MDSTLPRPEYPRPQCARPDWLNLNGEWQFEVDAGDSGEERGLVHRELTGSIRVPFCPESTLSGIGNTDFLNAVWYRRTVAVPAAWRGRRVLLHFQAVDDEATVWVDGQRVAHHRGGWTPFRVDLGDVGGRSVTIVVRARDNHREPKACGKQSFAYTNKGCRYTRTTGIWQTVWMEPVAPVALARPRLVPDVARQLFRVTLPLDLGLPRPRVTGLRVRATLRAAGKELAVVEAPVRDLAPMLDLPIPAGQTRLWSPADPFLYDLRFELLNETGAVADAVTSYAGLRSIQLDGRRVLLNGQPVFQRLVLDQGYYPDGILTAPSDAALVKDIELSMAAGFNGARLHQKVFEERFLHHADRLGYLVWGEYGDWGIEGAVRLEDVTVGWAEALQRDLSHPCIIGWCPLNEQFRFTNPDTERRVSLQRALFAITKAVDPSRPVIDISGGYHFIPESDVLDNHDYDQDPVKFADNYARLGATDQLREWWANPPVLPQIAGRPFFVSEFGGAWWDAAAATGGKDLQQGWGYGDRPKSAEEVVQRFAGLCGALLANPAIFGYCYTQLTDVYQEKNGVLTFDRQPKFDLARLRAIQSQPAAIEQPSER
jgi:beta-galactosidase/beta-glucuronidase